MQNSTPWVVFAHHHIGIREVPGARSNPWILNMWRKLKYSWLATDDSMTPWCGGFVGYCMQEAGIIPPKECYRAKEWLNWGKELRFPAYGCVGIMSRNGGGHVTIIVGKDEEGNLIGLGGNQNDSVKLSKFAPEKFLGFRYPWGYQPSISGLPAMSVMVEQNQSSE